MGGSNNNLNPNGPGPGFGAQGPAQVGPSQTPKNPLQASIDALASGKGDLKDVADLLTKIGEQLNKNNTNSDALRKTYKEHANELRHSLSFIEEMEGHTKKILEFQKLISRSGVKAASYFEIVKALKEMEKLNRTQLEKGIFSPKQTAILRRNVTEISKAMKELELRTGKAVSPDKAREVLELMVRINKETIGLAKNMKGVRMSSLTDDARSAERSLRHLFGYKDATAKYVNHAKMGTRLRKAHEAHVSGKHTKARDLRESILRDVPTHLLSKDRFTRADGSFDRAAYRKDRAVIQAHAASEARAKGMGGLGSRILGRHTAETASGGSPGIISRMGMNVLARGEGSIGTGIASMGLGAIEGGAATIAEMAGPLAPILVGLEVLKKMFDKNQTMNSDVADKLGGSGIYGGGNPLDSIKQVRANLNGKLFSPLGIGYDKNIAIAASMQQHGFGNQNLSSGELTQDRHGILGGSFGSLQRNVYAYGRLAGLDSSQTMDQTLKLVSQYKQSLGSTEDFFLRINKETRMAGMSTMKYIELIDEVNSHYSRSNKLIEATVDTMHLLSVTGRNTAEEIKEAMDAATSGNSKRSVEVKAYLGMQMFQDPEVVKRLQGGADLNLQDSIANASKALSPWSSPNAGYDTASLMQRIQSGGTGAISDLQVEARRHATDKNGNVDQTQLQAATSALQAVRTAFEKQQTLKSSLAMGPTRGGLAWGTSGAFLGDDLFSQKAYTINSIDIAMKKSGFKLEDTFNPAKQAQMNSSNELKGLLEVFGTDPEKFHKVITDLTSSAAASRVQIAQNGTAGMNLSTAEGKQQQQYLEDTYDLLKSKGAVGLGNSGNKSEDLKAYANSEMGEKTMNALLSSDKSTLLDIFSNPVLSKMMRPKIENADRDSRISDAEKLASGTRPTGEIFAEAFTALFNKLQTPLDFIANLLSHLPMFGLSDKASGSQVSAIEDLIHGGTADKALMALDQKISVLQDQLTHPKAGVTAAETQQQLDAAQAAKDRIASLKQADSDDTQKKFLLGTDTDQFVKDVNEANAAALQAGSSAATVDPRFLTGSTLNPETGTGTGVSSSGGVTTITNNYNSVGYTTEGADSRNALHRAPGDTAPLKKAN